MELLLVGAGVQPLTIWPRFTLQCAETMGLLSPAVTQVQCVGISPPPAERSMPVMMSSTGSGPGQWPMRCMEVEKGPRSLMIAGYISIPVVGHVITMEGGMNGNL